MLRTRLQSALCLLLTPLLVAQQVTTPHVTTAEQQIRIQPPSAAGIPDVVIPKGTRIEVVSLQNVSSLTAQKNAPVQFAVASNLEVAGVTVLYAGTSVEGRVAKVRRGIPHKRWGMLRIDIRSITINPHARLRLRSSDPEHSESMIDELAMCFLAAPYWCLPMIVLSLRSEKPGDSGAQKVSSACSRSVVWTASNFTISAQEVAESKAALPTHPMVSCGPP